MPVKTLLLLAAQSVAIFVVFGLALFVSAGSLVWLCGWIFLGLFFGFYVGVNLWLLRHNPGLVRERMKFGSSDQKGWDKLYFPSMLLFSMGWLVLMALDSVRFKWSHFPFWLNMVGAAVLLFSFYLLFLAFRTNSYLSTVVRVQTDRGHEVVSTGPYHYVRHPMYAAFLPFVVGTALLLGSGYGVVVGLVFEILVARRAVLEERTLVKELSGYSEYMAEVKYRIIPHVW